VLDPLLTGADQAMVNAFTGGFRVAQIKTAISKALPEPAAAAALESAQIVALAILVREQLYPIQFASIYRPFATVLPGPGYEAPPAVDRQIAAFLQRLPSLTGEAEAEAAAVAKVLGEPKLAEDVTYLTNADRVRNRETLTPHLSALTVKFARDDLIGQDGDLLHIAVRKDALDELAAVLANPPKTPGH